MNATHKLTISLLTSEESNAASRVELSAEELIRTLSEYQERDSKSGGAWSPFVWRGDKREAARAELFSALVYDLDWSKTRPTEEVELLLRGLLERLDEMLLPFALHETYNAGRFRLAIPMSEPLPASQHERIWSNMARGLQLDKDDACSDLARLYFLPSHPPGESRRFFRSSESAVPFSEPAHYLKNHLQPPKETSRSITQADADSSSFLRMSLADVTAYAKGQSSKLKADSRQLVRAALAGELQLMKGEREIKLHQLVTALASCLPPETPFETLLALLLPTIDAIEGKDEEKPGYFEKRVKRSFEKSRAFRKARAAKFEVREKFLNPEPADPEAWRLKLLTTSTREGPVTKSCTFNLDLILDNDPAFRGHIQFNELKRRVELSGVLGNCSGDRGLELSNWLQASEYQMDIPADKCGAALLQTAKRNPLNPVRSYLESLEWDGLPRVNDFLEAYCGAEGNPNYIKSISRKFFLSAAARALEPGCKVDTTLVLHGPMGTKKTSLIETLSRGWYTTMSHRVEDKDTRMQTTGAWFVELSELSSLSKSGIEHIRGFLTQRSDHIRLPYGREIEEFPRRCVFVGTTNSDYPLRDPEGNRRYWVISCGDINLPMVERTVDQLWAESVQLFRTYCLELEAVAASTMRESDMKHRWWLTPDEQEESNAENSIYELQDQFEVEIQNWLRRPVTARPTTLTPSEALIKILRWSPREVQDDMGAQLRMGRAMRKLKWQKCTYGPRTARVRAYKVPEVDEDSLNVN